MVTDKDTAHKLVMRHITSGTLFSTGMRFYQVRDSLQAGNAITLQKVNQGKLNKWPLVLGLNKNQSNRFQFF